MPDVRRRCWSCLEPMPDPVSCTRLCPACTAEVSTRRQQQQRASARSRGQRVREAQRTAPGPNMLACCGRWHRIETLPCRLLCCGRVLGLPEAPAP